MRSPKEDIVRIVGGGPKKVLYTLQTLARIGLKDSAKALKANNTCKACGLGMGGQKGGMTNELNEFPSVCNKSIQAQSTDIQPPIPSALFEQHSLDDFRDLSSRELEHLGRLDTPLYKAPGSQHYSAVSWDKALGLAAKTFQDVSPEKSFFYASGRSSNEAAFLLQLLARAYGTNNVNNCSYYCHQATGVGLQNTLGTGTSTVSLDDVGESDCIVVIGANPSSNHPRFIHQLMHCRERGGQVIVINPAKEPGLVKFAVPKSAKSMLKGGSEIASEYIQPKIGGDLALLMGIAKAWLESNEIDVAFITEHTQGFDELKQSLQAVAWSELCESSGIEQEAIIRLANKMAAAQKMIIAWGMGITHHQQGVDNVEAIANLVLLRGMVGKKGAGLLPLRGHSNVQGVGTVGVKPELAKPVLDKLEQVLGLSLPQEKGLDTLACLRAAHAGEMDAALLLGGNLYAATPNSRWAEEALNAIRFKMYLTTTLNAGHFHGVSDGEVLVLPVSARDEELQPTTQESMFNFVRMSDGGIERLHHARPESAVFSEFAAKLLPDSPIDFAALRDHDAIRKLIAECIPNLQPLENISQTKEEFTINGRVLHRPVFNMPEQKARFACTALFQSRLTEQYPFMLASIRSEGQFNSIIYEEKDSYRRNADRQTVLMNSDDMQALSLEDDDVITLQSPYGELPGLKAKAFPLPSKNVLAYYPEANVLIGLEQDLRSQTPAFKTVPIMIIPQRTLSNQ